MFQYETKLILDKEFIMYNSPLKLISRYDNKKKEEDVIKEDTSPNSRSRVTIVIMDAEQRKSYRDKLKKKLDKIDNEHENVRKSLRMTIERRQECFAL